MRRIAIINQKGGVGKTTTAANLGSALARLGRRVVLLDLDPQANLSLHLGTDLASGEPSTYDLLLGRETLADCLRDTTTAGLQLLPAHIDLSGAELELASAFGREILLREALDTWESASQEAHGEAPADYVILDCPPSLSLLSVNGLAAAHEVIVTLQTEFFALQGISKLVEVIQLIRRRINPALTVAGILPTLYDTRLRLAREVLAEIRRYFPGQVFSRPIRTNVKLAEAPSHGVSIFEYAPNSSGARDYLVLAREIMAAETQDPELGHKDLPVPAVEELEAALAQMARSPKPHKRRATRPESGDAEASADPIAIQPELQTIELTPSPSPQSQAKPGPNTRSVTRAPSPSPPSPATDTSLKGITTSPNQEIHFGAIMEPLCREDASHLAATRVATPATQATAEGPQTDIGPPTQVDPREESPDPAPNYNFTPNNGAERTHMPTRSRLGPLAGRPASGPGCP
jgi:chromosome partitioning protein